MNCCYRAAHHVSKPKPLTSPRALPILHETPRYAPQLPLPPYSYVPGLFPHPVSDPVGHMHGQHEADMPRDDATSFGFDLFNHGYYWEAHEAWEHCWVAEDRQGELADALKGLIKLAAAGVKAREGKPEGVRRHARRAEQLLRASSSPNQTSLPESWRQASADWAEQARRVHETADQWIDTRDQPVIAVFDFTLERPPC